MTSLRHFCLAVLATALVLLSPVPVLADETVSIGGVNSVLIRPVGTVKGSLILMAGGDGRLNVGPDGTFASLAGNQVIRTRQAYVARGFAVLLLEQGANLGAAIQTMRSLGAPVTVVATSRGTQRAVRGIAGGARPDALVLTSGMLSDASGAPENAIRILGSPATLPRTLVIAHASDSCFLTLPAGVAPFQQWAGGKVRVEMLSGGRSVGPPCEARAYHGFNGLDDRVVSLVASFAPTR